ncbi:hypothetical protein [Dactylosporangium sp. CA-233914]|uniref:hypothetical protein n=1 Tax=Dactylosporangium sp. CA-233914 TaxID=3239934 RepID=UPI003D92FDEC
MATTLSAHIGGGQGRKSRRAVRPHPPRVPEVGTPIVVPVARPGDPRRRPAH